MRADASRVRLQRAIERAEGDLWQARNPQGHWTGELSSSALSTATAVAALAIGQSPTSEVGSPNNQGPTILRDDQISAGLEWLARNVNADGGWGDTVMSLSNLSTTVLCWAAFGAVGGADEKYRATVANAERWLTKKAGTIQPDLLASAIIRSYGKDRTFSVPILTMCALAGRLGAPDQAWGQVIPLPFELAACPHQWFAALRLPVVSYALPALIAIGQARHHHQPSRNPIARLLRSLTRRRTLKILNKIQPSSGGFLEATPLTSFVVMSLAGSGQADHPVTVRGLEFLKAAQQTDGSWPIDSNLATWVTTLAVNAVVGQLPRQAQRGSTDAPTEAGVPSPGTPVPSSDLAAIRSWLLAQQHREEHPYTHAAPGAWAWTDLPGGVPDADDTAGALLALRALERPRKQPGQSASASALQAACSGVSWLLDLQNRNGGIPTFCRGWGALPFDRSSPDITAHAIRAWLAWLDDLPQPLQKRTRKALTRAVEFLRESQRADGSWSPLWFGNQLAPNDENLTYGTSRILCALAALVKRKDLGIPLAATLYHRAVQWLVKAQNSDGGWGGAFGIGSSVEETALSVEALAVARQTHVPSAESALARGTNWLLDRVENGQWKQPAPIGFYFAKLWYYERLYPIIFTVGALKQVCLRTSDASD